MRSLALNILQTYVEKQDSAEFDEQSLKEVVLLGGMKDPFIYRQLLKTVVSDIDNDSLLEAFKLRCLATVLLYIVAADPSKQSIKSYCNGDDLKECLDIITKKFKTVLLNDDSENLH